MCTKDVCPEQPERFGRSLPEAWSGGSEVRSWVASGDAATEDDATRPALEVRSALVDAGEVARVFVQRLLGAVPGAGVRAGTDPGQLAERPRQRVPEEDRLADDLGYQFGDLDAPADGSA